MQWIIVVMGEGHPVQAAVIGARFDSTARKVTRTAAERDAVTLLRL